MYDNDQLHPPDTNRGVETHTTQQIDWISLTFPHSVKREDIFPDGLSTASHSQKSFNAYDSAEAYEDGRILLWHTTRQEMGTHVVLSGRTCANLRAELEAIINHCWAKGGKVVRFDVALNDRLSRVHPEHATELLRSGEKICRAKEYPVRNDPTLPGYSQYAGKFASETHVCIYDKSAEQGECGFEVRIEIRFKGKKADKAAHEYLRNKNAGALIKGFLDFPNWKEWQEVIGSDAVSVPAEKKDSNTVAWLLGQVAKSMAGQIYLNDGDLEIMERFRVSVDAYLSDLRHKRDDDDIEGVG